MKKDTGKVICLGGSGIAVGIVPASNKGCLYFGFNLAYTSIESDGNTWSFVLPLHPETDTIKSVNSNNSGRNRSFFISLGN